MKDLMDYFKFLGVSGSGAAKEERPPRTKRRRFFLDTSYDQNAHLHLHPQHTLDQLTAVDSYFYVFVAQDVQKRGDYNEFRGLLATMGQEIFNIYNQCKTEIDAHHGAHRTNAAIIKEVRGDPGHLIAEVDYKYGDLEHMKWSEDAFKGGVRKAVLERQAFPGSGQGDLYRARFGSTHH